MCGICGIFRPDKAPVDPARVEKMRDLMAYRGPDGFGLTHGPGFALGHRRLAIIDLSEAGKQPIFNEDDTVQITFNGEIYNFNDLRPELEAAGHRFRSRTDSEVLVHGYEEWGLEGLLKRIRGMFALALLDSRSGEIHLARDPLGKKPLFFRFADGELAFASSARALVQALPSIPEIDVAAIDDLLWNLYIPGPRTIFAGIEKLLPGHGLTIGPDGKRRDLQYWQPDFMHPEQGVPEEEWLDRIEASLTCAVKRRLVADVPLGVLLSGGVDSSLVTAVAAKAAGRVKTFSVATEDPALDESSYAKAVADRYDTDHHTLPVRSDVKADLPCLVAAMGEPLADASAANLFAIAKLARQHVTVVLTGDGGDEGFGGYSQMWVAHNADQLRRYIPSPLRPLAASGAALLQRGPGNVHRAGTLLKYAAEPLERTFGETGWLKWEDRTSLYTPEFSALLGKHRPIEHYIKALSGQNGALLADRVMQAQLETILADDYLPKVDLATMAVSLEGRSPFLDQDLMELAMRIPAKTRFSGGTPKALLRSLARRHLPAEGVDRRKQGFVAPVGRWLRSDWSDLVDDFILGPHVEQRGWFNRAALQQMVNEHRSGINHAYLLWTLLILEMWVRMTVDDSL